MAENSHDKVYEKDAKAMGKNERSYQRRTVVIDREFQLGFIFRFGGFLLFYLLFFLMVVIVGPVVLALMGGEREWAVLEMSFRVEVLLRLILVPLACTFLCLFVHGILETFRIAGPNYRFRKVLDQVRQLKLPKGVHIRKSDYLQDTADSMNQALIRLHKHVAVCRDRSQRAWRAVQNKEIENTAAYVGELNDALMQFELLTAAPGCEPIDPEQQYGTATEPVDEEPTKPVQVP